MNMPSISIYCCIYVTKASANDRRPCLCNVLYLWLTPGPQTMFGPKDSTSTTFDEDWYSCVSSCRHIFSIAFITRLYKVTILRGFFLSSNVICTKCKGTLAINNIMLQRAVLQGESTAPTYDDDAFLNYIQIPQTSMCLNIVCLMLYYTPLFFYIRSDVHPFIHVCTMKTSSNGSIFRVTGPFAGNSPISGEFLAQRPVTRSFDITLICARINGWVNNREAGDLRRYRVHCDVIVMLLYFIPAPDNITILRCINNQFNNKELYKRICSKYIGQCIW